METGKTWRDWSALLQVVLNAEASIQGAYQIGGPSGAWIDGADRGDVRSSISQAARDIRSAMSIDPDTDRADRVFQSKSVPLIQKAIRHGSSHGLEEEVEIMRDLLRLKYRAAAVDGWRDLRRSVRLGLDAATAKAGVPNVPPASVSIRVGPKVGRNEPCPCGSGKKHKRCCLS